MSHSDELPSANTLSALQHHLSGTLSLSPFRTVTRSRYLNLDLKHICSPPSMLLNCPVVLYCIAHCLRAVRVRVCLQCKQCTHALKQHCRRFLRQRTNSPLPSPPLPLYSPPLYLPSPPLPPALPPRSPPSPLLPYSPSSPLLFPPFEAGLLNTAQGSGERCKLPQSVWDEAPADKRFGAYSSRLGYLSRGSGVGRR